MDKISDEILEEKINAVEAEASDGKGRFSAKDYLIWAAVVLITLGLTIAGAFM
jgi:hypothetical protein